MQVDTRSRLFVAYTAVMGAVVVGLVARIRGDEVNEWYAAFMAAGAAAGVFVGTAIRNRHR